jgi:hypothetical protein
MTGGFTANYAEDADGADTTHGKRRGLGRSGEKQRASANLEFARAASLRDQIMEGKSGIGLTSWN